MINREVALNAFKEYVTKYNPDDEKIRYTKGCRNCKQHCKRS